MIGPMPVSPKAILTKYPVLKHVGTLVSGTVLAQVVALLTQPIITRLYSDTELGLFSLWLVIPQTVVLVAALRYDMAVVLPTEETDARRLLRVSAVIIAAVSLLTSLVTGILAGPIATAMGYPQLAPWLVWTGAFVLTLGIVNLLTFWFTRRTQYRAIAINRVQMYSTVAGTKIASAAAGAGGQVGLVVGQIVGQATAAATLAYKAREALFRPSGSTVPVRELLGRYKKMPLLNAPNALIDGVRLNGIMLMLGIVYAAATVGQFSQAWLLMQAPVTLVAGAISQVFYQKFATAKPGELTRLVTSSITMSAAIGIVPFALLAVIAPWFFPWFLGESWAEAGLIGQALVPWLFVNVATAPVSTIFVVTNRQQEMLAFAVVYATAPLLLIYLLGPTTPVVPLVWAVSLTMAALLVGLLLLTRRAARRFDATEGDPQ